MQCVQAAQVTFEDYFLSELSIAPLKVVGYEGLFGVLFQVLIILPAAQLLPGPDGHGVHENTVETFHVRALRAGVRDQVAPDMR